MELFFTNKLTKTTALFDGEEARHLIKALRKTKGESIHFTDGQGYLYEGLIDDVTRNSVTVNVLQKTEQPKSWKGSLTLAIAATKNFGRIELLLEKAVELGIDQIIPISTSRTEKKSWNMDRVHRIIISASKQSLKHHFPVLQDLMKFDDFLTFSESWQDHQKFIPHCNDGEKVSWSTMLQDGNNVCIAIGPEGDFTNEEVSSALDYGFKAMTLGDQRLRTETAGLKSCVGFHLLQEIED